MTTTCEIDLATILIIDDLEANRYAMSRVLERSGLRVIQAVTGIEGLARARQMPDLILLDVQLPDLDGFEVCRRLKADPVTASIPVLQISADFVSREDKVLGLQSGADGYLIQPVGSDELLASVQTRLRIQQTEKALRQSEERYRLTFENAAVGMAHVALDGRWLRVNERLSRIVGYSREELLAGLTFQDITYPEDLDTDLAQLGQLLRGQIPTYSMEKRYRHKNGHLVWTNLTVSLQRDEAGQPLFCIVVIEDISRRKQSEEELRRIEWMLTRSTRPQQAASRQREYFSQSYGDLTRLNTNRLILDTIGEETLTRIVGDSLDLLDTSAAVYEKNGDYALGIFSSNWCHFMDQSSRELCGSCGSREALACGRWLCHESCWGESSRVSIERNEPVDVECAGGLRLYAVPIRAGDEVVGSMNLGYGNPPRDEATLRELAGKYGIDYEEMKKRAEAYESRPQFMIDLAKRRLRTSAELVGAIIHARQAEKSLHAYQQRLHYHVQNSPLAVIEWDANFRVARWTGAAEKLFGWKAEEVLGKLSCEWPFIYEEDQPEAHLVMARLLRGEDPRNNLANRNYRKDGTIVHCEWYNSALRDEQGRILSILSLALDVTERKRVEEALRESEDRFRSVLENSLDAAYRRDLRTDTYDYLSPVIEQVMGIGVERMRNMLTEELIGRIHPEDRRQVQAAIQEGLRLRKGRVDYRFRTDDGHYRWLADYFTVQTDAAGMPLLRCGIVRDVTESKHAEAALRASEERLQKAISIDTVGVLFFNLEGCILDVNATFERMTGYSREELRHAVQWSELTAPEFLEATARTTERLANQGETPPYEKQMIRKDGSRWWGLFAPTRLAGSGRGSECVEFIIDITERKRAEEAVREANERLQDADRRKDEFLAMLAHELRNPLAPMRNAVQILNLAGSKEPLLLRQREIIDRQVTHMARLLDDLLDVSRITRGKINLKKETVYLADVLARAVETAMPLIEAHRHTLSVQIHSEAEQVFGDFDRLIQIVGNLLTNAAKYTENGGRIWLESMREGGMIAIRVRDTGLGIAPELLPKVFDVFTQAERSLDRSQGGLGLGLTLVRSLTEMHGGSVEARSAGVGQGSEFTIRLPALPVPGASPHPHEKPAPPHDAAARRILVVDDVADTANSLAELLGLMGHEVKAAYDGVSALRLAREFRPDVMLLDIGLPGMNGFEVARQVQLDPALEGTVLVALTGYGQEEDRRQAEEAGFVQHFTKPVELRVVKELLDRMESKL